VRQASTTDPMETAFYGFGRSEVTE
jgi:hypothetical protein